MTDTIKEIFAAEVNAIHNIPINNYLDGACDLICQAILQNNSKAVAIGMGKVEQIALNIATTLSAAGTLAVFFHPS